MRIDQPLRRPRRPNLTPMIDVVLLLLVFFMMVSRFGGMQGVPLGVSGGGVGDWSGPPRLVRLTAEGVSLNGVAVPVPDLVERLGALMSGPDEPVILQSSDGADVQHLVTLMDALRAGGIRRVMMAE